MKRLVMLIALLSTCLFLLTGCKGSKAIQGTWQVENSLNQAGELVLTDKTFTLNGGEYQYKQNGLGNVNGIQYYTIDLEDDKDKYLTFVFPTKSRTVAFLIESEDSDDPTRGKILMVLDKEKQPDYQEYIEKYKP